MATAESCVNCAAPLAGAYCAACGQRAVEPHVGTWHVLREGLPDVADFDGRSIGTLRALVAPGRLTSEFLRGRRAPYLGPIKLFLFAGTVLTTTWMLTRGGCSLLRHPALWIDGGPAWIVPRGRDASRIARQLTTPDAVAGAQRNRLVHTTTEPHGGPFWANNAIA
jgi:hypothetical protein